MDDHTLDPNAGDIRRIEVITGTGRRRRWSAETKAQIIAESFAVEAVGVGGGAPTWASAPAAVWLAPLCPERTIGGQQRGPAGICSDDNRWRNGAGIVRRHGKQCNRDRGCRYDRACARPGRGDGAKKPRLIGANLIQSGA